MGRWLKWLGGLALTVAVAAAVLALWGALLPREHRASATVHVEVPPALAFEVAADVEGAEQWREGVDRVEMLDDSREHLRWREHGEGGTRLLERVKAEPPSRLVVRVADADAGSGGRWIYTMKRTTRGTALTLTEHGWIDNPLLRIVERHGGELDERVRREVHALAAEAERRAAAGRDEER